jgi:alpha-1,2-mannosyltransferase
MARLLTPVRLRYAWIAGIALWGGWLLSGLGGSGNLDLAGQVIGTDYLQFYAAGWMIRHGQAARLYDPEAQLAAERAIIGPRLPAYHAFLNPPFFALLFVPLSLPPYPISFAIWSALQLLLLALSLRALRPAGFLQATAWALTFLPVFASVSFGQNGLLSLALLTGVWLLWRRNRAMAAGALSSLLLYKPHLLLGLLLFYLAEGPRGRRALLGLFLTGAALAALSGLLLPEATRAYLDLAQSVYPDLPGWKEFPLWHLHSPRGFWRLLLPGQPRLADALALLSALMAAGAAFRFWRRHREDPLRFAAAVVLTVYLTPHAMIYDWSILLLPALLLWEHAPAARPALRAAFALVWIAFFLGAPLTAWMARRIGWGIQWTLPALTAAGGEVKRSLREEVGG